MYRNWLSAKVIPWTSVIYYMYIEMISHKFDKCLIASSINKGMIILSASGQVYMQIYGAIQIKVIIINIMGHPILFHHLSIFMLVRGFCPEGLYLEGDLS